MKLLIINNGSAYINNIIDRVGEKCDYFVYDYSPNIDINTNGYDAIILSGGSKNEVIDKTKTGQYFFRKEFELLRNTKLPVFGICLGLQMINFAFGGTLRQMPTLVNGNKTITLNQQGQQLFNNQDIVVHKYHHWVVDNINLSEFEVLATSKEGIEIIKHKTKSLIACQFHPEIDVNYDSEELFWSLLNHVYNNMLQGVGM